MVELFTYEPTTFTLRRIVQRIRSERRLHTTVCDARSELSKGKIHAYDIKNMGMHRSDVMQS